MLCLWFKLEATAPIQPLAWELPYAAGVALKKKLFHRIYYKKILRQESRYKGKRMKDKADYSTLGIKAEKSFLFPPPCMPRVGGLHIFILLHSFSFLGMHSWHMEVPRLGIESELQLLAYATATATPDPRRICDLHRGSVQCQILNPLSGASNQTHILMDTCWVC